MAQVLKTHKSFGGTVRFWEHDSSVTKTKMKFSTYTPPGKMRGALIWLSGLTCTDENFMVKAGAQKHLADAGLILGTHWSASRVAAINFATAFWLFAT